MVLFNTCTCFFFEVPPLEESQDPDSSPRREEVGRRTPRDYGGFLVAFFYRDRFQLLFEENSVILLSEYLESSEW